MEKVSEKEIDEVIKEYSKKCYDGTDKPIELSRRQAQLICESRKRFQKYLNSVHKSHDLTDWYTEPKAPAGTMRFYNTRKCKTCGGEQYYHAAGKFIDPELTRECIKDGEPM